MADSKNDKSRQKKKTKNDRATRLLELKAQSRPPPLKSRTEKMFEIVQRMDAGEEVDDSALYSDDETAPKPVLVTGQVVESEKDVEAIKSERQARAQGTLTAGARDQADKRRRELFALGVVDDEADDDHHSLAHDDGQLVPSRSINGRRQSTEPTAKRVRLTVEGQSSSASDSDDGFEPIRPEDLAQLPPPLEFMPPTTVEVPPPPPALVIPPPGRPVPPPPPVVRKLTVPRGGAWKNPSPRPNGQHSTVKPKATPVVIQAAPVINAVAASTISGKEHNLVTTNESSGPSVLVPTTLRKKGAVNPVSKVTIREKMTPGGVASNHDEYAHFLKSLEDGNPSVPHPAPEGSV